MAANIIQVTDLPAPIQSEPLAATWVAGANAAASRVAPCLASTNPAPTGDQLAEAKLVLLGAVQRWAEAGSGALQAQTAGPFGITVDTRQKASGYRLWPSDISHLQDICGGVGSEAFAVDTVTPPKDGVWTSPYWFQEG